MELTLEDGRPLETAGRKNLFLCNRQKSAYYLLMLAGDKTFRTKEISAQIESARLSFAGAEDMGNYLNIEPGAVSVLGLMNDTENRVRLLVDKQDVMAALSAGASAVSTTCEELWFA